MLAVSSQATRAAVMSLQNKISSKIILVNVSKGLEKGTNKRISEVVGELLPSNSSLWFYQDYLMQKRSQ